MTQKQIVLHAIPMRAKNVRCLNIIRQRTDQIKKGIVWKIKLSDQSRQEVTPFRNLVLNIFLLLNY